MGEKCAFLGQSKMMIVTKEINHKYQALVEVENLNISLKSPTPSQRHPTESFHVLRVLGNLGAITQSHRLEP